MKIWHTQRQRYEPSRTARVVHAACTVAKTALGTAIVVTTLASVAVWRRCTRRKRDA